MGDPGRLSLEDRECWRPEEKLRLVWSTEDGFEILLNRDFRLGTGMVSARKAEKAGVLGPPCLPAHRSWVSRRRLRLLRRAMRPLATFFRAGPTLMEVFSRAVVRREILLPLCRRNTSHPKAFHGGKTPVQHLTLRSPQPWTSGCAVGTRSGQGSMDRTFSSSSTTSM